MGINVPPSGNLRHFQTLTLPTPCSQNHPSKSLTQQLFFVPSPGERDAPPSPASLKREQQSCPRGVPRGTQPGAAVPECFPEEREKKRKKRGHLCAAEDLFGVCNR